MKTTAHTLKPIMNKPQPKRPMPEETPLVEGEDFYLEGAMIVFTALYHLRRGYCCGSGCRHCPYATRENTGRESARYEEHEADSI